MFRKDIMVSKGVKNVLKDALMEVTMRKHEWLTVEHLLYAITKNTQGRELLEKVGVDIERLCQYLEMFFQKELEQTAQYGSQIIPQTAGVQRVIDRVVVFVRNAGRNQVEIPDLLVAIFDEDHTYAQYYLRSLGVDRLNLVTVISQSGASRQGCEKCEDEENDKRDPLEKYTEDLTAKAAEGRLDPLVGREHELDRAIEVLCRRRKNNPLFVGDPGVGKTAMAEGLALRIAEGKIPEMFRDTRIFSLDMGSTLAGTRYRGDFEARLKSIVEALKKIPKAILFIDEIHTLVGAGATTGGSMDASNLLKPALANGELRCIGSTTYEEFRNHFEKDRALARRFQRIDLREPDTENCLAILQGLEKHYSAHHNVKYGPAILKAMVDLTTRHVRDRMQPDKSIDVMDECGASVRLRSESQDISQVLMSDVERVVARMANIPTASVTGTERTRLANLEKDLKRLVFGQDEAIEKTVKAILRSRAGLSSEKRPAGSFLFYGPTGVGKTEVARSLAEIMGVEFHRFDMSEYMEQHTVSRLIGSPPGYVGFEQGGLLTEAVRKAPYSVVLLDEVEKAHPDIFNILLQVMDYGTLTDNTGRKTDFSNVILILTSNAGAFEMSKSSIGFGETQQLDASRKGLKAVERIFSPEFRNRLDAMVPFRSLDETMMLNIVDKFINQIRKTLQAKKVELSISDKARHWLAKEGYDPAMGARPMRRLLRSEVEDKLAAELLFGSLKKGGKAKLSLQEGELVISIEKPVSKKKAPALV